MQTCANGCGQNPATLCLVNSHMLRITMKTSTLGRLKQVFYIWDAERQLFCHAALQVTTPTQQQAAAITKSGGNGGRGGGGSSGAVPEDNNAVAEVCAHLSSAMGLMHMMA